MSGLDKIETEIQATLEKISADAAPRGWWGNRTAWTRTIKDRLRELAQRFDCRGDEGWLYDVYWYRMTRGDAGFLVSLPLVVECEWSPDPEMDGDFQKLVQARAEHRLWIFGVDTAEDIARYFSACKEQIAKFQGAEKGDRYLLAGIDKTYAKFCFEHHVAQ